MLLKSIIKAFSLLKVLFQSDNDEVPGFWVQCNSCNKTFTCQFLKQCLYNSFHFFSDLLCFIMSVYHGWYKPKSNLNSLLRINLLNCIQVDHGLVLKMLKRTWPHIWVILCHCMSRHIWHNVWISFLRGKNDKSNDAASFGVGRPIAKP